MAARPLAIATDVAWSDRLTSPTPNELVPKVWARGGRGYRREEVACVLRAPPLSIGGKRGGSSLNETLSSKRRPPRAAGGRARSARCIRGDRPSRARRSRSARRNLGDLAVVNEATAEATARGMRARNDQRLSDCQRLRLEPAIARLALSTRMAITRRFTSARAGLPRTVRSVSAAI